MTRELQFPKTHREALRLAMMVLCELESEEKATMRVHEATRVIGHVLQSAGILARVVDGTVAGVPHSWIWIDEPYPSSLLDVCALGRLPRAQLIEAARADDYQSGPFRSDIDADYVEGAAARVGRQLAYLYESPATCQA